MAVRLRLSWRIQAGEAEREQRATEALQIIRDSAAFVSHRDVAVFSMIAALRTEDSLRAMATANRLADDIEFQMKEKDAPLGESSFKTLERIAAFVDQQVLFPNVEQARYQELRNRMNRVLQAARQRRRAR